MNTHLDDQGGESRLQAAKIIIEQIRFFADYSPSPGKLPVFLAGDFNSEPNQEAYNEMTSSKSPMADLRLIVDRDNRYGDENTLTDFKDCTRPKRIDFVFLNGKVPQPLGLGISGSPGYNFYWGVNTYAVLPNRFEDGVYNSDHRAVVGDVLL